MMRLLAILVLLPLALPLSAGAEAPMPAEAALGGWKAREAPAVYSPGNLFDYIDGGAEIFIEFGFRELTLQTFRKESHEICVELYRMDSPEAALGIYYRQCGPNKGRPGDPFHIARSPFQWSLRKGEWYAQLNSPSGSAGLESALELFSRLILDAIEPRTVLLFSDLPVQGRVADSEFVVRGPYAMETVFTFGEGNILGLGGKTFGIGASFIDPAIGKYLLMQIDYSEKEMAGYILSDLKLKLDKHLQILEALPERIAFRDYKNEYGLVVKDHNRLVFYLHLKQNLAEKGYEGPL